MVRYYQIRSLDRLNLLGIVVQFDGTNIIPLTCSPEAMKKYGCEISNGSLQVGRGFFKEPLNESCISDMHKRYSQRRYCNCLSTLNSLINSEGAI